MRVSLCWAASLWAPRAPEVPARRPRRRRPGGPVRHYPELRLGHHAVHHLVGGAGGERLRQPAHSSTNPHTLPHHNCTRGRRMRGPRVACAVERRSALLCPPFHMPRTRPTAPPSPLGALLQAFAILEMPLLFIIIRLLLLVAAFQVGCGTRRCWVRSAVLPELALAASCVLSHAPGCSRLLGLLRIEIDPHLPRWLPPWCSCASAWPGCATCCRRPRWAHTCRVGWWAGANLRDVDAIRRISRIRRVAGHVPHLQPVQARLRWP